MRTYSNYEALFQVCAFGGRKMDLSLSSLQTNFHGNDIYEKKHFFNVEC